MQNKPCDADTEAGAGPLRKAMAVWVITRHGLATAATLKQNYPGADVLVSRRLQASAPEYATIIDLPLGPLLAENFQSYDCHVFIISVGAVVRMVAPFLQNKKVDPAVVCIDDTARFVVSTLSGHVGRGNEYTIAMAEMLGAEPVVTTASDALGTLTVDILGRELGWQLDDPDRNVTAGCAAVVNAAAVAFVQETGEPNWWPRGRALPPGVEYMTSLDAVDPAAFEMLLICSDRHLAATHPQAFAKAVIYRPKSLMLGIGCDRGTSRATLERGVHAMVEAAGLCMRSVAGVATLDLKADEPGLVEMCRAYSWPLHSYAAELLDNVQGVENPSEVVRRHVGTRSVGEAAALHAAGSSRLVLAKQKYRDQASGLNMTLAIARKPFPVREVP